MVSPYFLPTLGRYGITWVLINLDNEVWWNRTTVFKLRTSNPVVRTEDTLAKSCVWLHLTFKNTKSKRLTLRTSATLFQALHAVVAQKKYHPKDSNNSSEKEFRWATGSSIVVMTLQPAPCDWWYSEIKRLIFYLTIELHQLDLNQWHLD